MRPTSAAPPPAVRSGPDPACPKDPEGGPPKVPLGTVSFAEAPNAPRLETEMMATEPHRTRGLMWRQEMGGGYGMLFVFDDTDIRTFWMHNTCIPLDMLFLTEDGFITGILENVPTLNDDPRSIPCPVKYVLEVNAGFARRYGIKAGQTVKISLPGR